MRVYAEKGRNTWASGLRLDPSDTRFVTDGVQESTFCNFTVELVLLTWDT